MVEWFLDYGADPNARCEWDFTPTNKPNALDVVCRLVEQGAPINEVKYKTEPIVYLERKPFGLGTPLYRAAELGKGDIVKYLLEQGADPLKLDSKGKTLRFWAQKNNYIGIARILLEAEDISIVLSLVCWSSLPVNC
ncbi:hypothetical protein K432DRAFT_420104 [Lepidopterella palustris CBS 459.81]|uniref:Ankyrin n=1 Tax=Lepidopterella palustris CBS 459.81 TaxID=1314670 RepID=A0A8E2JA26_9PEZI|nr:hypothetical protein K432DRAFT_420104 [Lepidopterella palustris CBS 459.81]